MGTVNQIDFKYQESTEQHKKYSIGSTFDNVVYGEKQNDNGKFYNYSLKDFFNTVKSFFSKQMHMIYQSTAPTNKKIMEWYEVIPVSSNPTSDETQAAANN